MQNIGDRIMEVIKKQGITKSSFADRLNISQAYVSQMTTQGKIPSDRTIMDICREFNINETWLRTGAGEMMAFVDAEQEIEDFIHGMLLDDPDFRRAFIRVLARMSSDEWGILEAKAKELMKEMETPSSIENGAPQ